MSESVVLGDALATARAGAALAELVRGGEAIALVGDLGLVGGGGAGAPAHAERRGFDPAAIYRVPLGGAPKWGPADAPVTIVVWSDYACGYCNRVQPTLDGLQRLYPGQLRWVFRTLPLDDDVTLAAEASLSPAAQC